MPQAAWVEIRDAEGELLESIPAEIEGGGIYAELPAFPSSTWGTVQLCTRLEGKVWREEAELRELPSSPLKQRGAPGIGPLVRERNWWSETLKTRSPTNGRGLKRRLGIAQV